MSGRGGLSWWPNRKSKMGLRAVVAKAPPRLPDGREWWCEPPVAAPEPAYIEYVDAFRRDLMARPQTKHRDALLKSTSDWMRAARRLCHERMGDGSYVDAPVSTEDLIVEARSVVHHLIGALTRVGHGDAVTERAKKLSNLLSGRSDEILRRRALDPAHRVRRVPGPSDPSRPRG